MVKYLNATKYKTATINHSSYRAAETDILLFPGDLSSVISSLDNIVVTDINGTAYKSIKEGTVSAPQIIVKCTPSTVIDTILYVQYGPSLSYVNDTSLWTDIGIPPNAGANRYSMDEAAGTIVGAQGDNLTNVGGTMGVNRQVGKAWQGNANTGYLYGATNATLNYERNQAFTLLSMPKTATIDLVHLLITKRTSGAVGVQFYRQGIGNTLNFLIMTDPYYLQKATIDSFTLVDSYYTFVGTYDGSGTSGGMLLYANGTPRLTSISNDNLSGGSILNAGKFAVCAYNTTSLGSFIADETRVYNVVKSADYIYNFDLAWRQQTGITIGNETALSSGARRRRFYSGFGPGVPF